MLSISDRVSDNLTASTPTSIFSALSQDQQKTRIFSHGSDERPLLYPICCGKTNGVTEPQREKEKGNVITHCLPLFRET